MAGKDLIPATDAVFDSFQDNLVEEVTTNATAWNIAETGIYCTVIIENNKREIPKFRQILTPAFYLLFLECSTDYLCRYEDFNGLFGKYLPQPYGRRYFTA